MIIIGINSYDVGFCFLKKLYESNIAFNNAYGQKN